MRNSPLSALITGLALLFIVIFSVGAVGVLQALPNEKQIEATTSALVVDTPAFAAGVEARVRSADPSQGAALFSQYGCAACHSVEGGVAPYVVGVGQRAAGRRAPAYSAAAYLYEAIVDPNAYVVANYTPGIMPQNFKTTLPEDHLYALIAWLLTQ